MKEKIKKGDLALLIIIVSMVLISLLYRSNVLRGNERQGKKLIIEVDGKLVYEKKLNQASKKEQIRVNSKDGKGYNIIEVEGDRVHVEKSNCKNQICVHQGVITEAGQSLICLPNRIVARIESSGAEEEIDHVNY